MCATGLRHAPTVKRELSQISRSASRTEGGAQGPGGGPAPTVRRELSQISRRASRTEARAQRPETVANAPEGVRVGRFLHAELELVGAPRLGDAPLLGAFQREPRV